MNSFHDFLDDKLRKEVSKEGQLAQYAKSLRSLSKVKERLLANGMETKDIDYQVDQLTKAMERRLSGTHHWFGDIIRIEQEHIGRTLMWKLSSRDYNITFHIPTTDTAGVIKIPNNWSQYPNALKPMSRFIEYKEDVFGYTTVNLITYAESRTVDIIPIRTHKEDAQYYLIKRRDSNLWATVGGHIDQGELEEPILAARRELKEETQAEPLAIKQLPGGWVKSIVADLETPVREYNSWTLPYVAIVNPYFLMKPGDDAIGGEWFEVGHTPDNFHFSHHRTILRRAFKFLPTLLGEFGKH